LNLLNEIDSQLAEHKIKKKKKNWC
jgi:hypothetical protein